MPKKRPAPRTAGEPAEPIADALHSAAIHLLRRLRRLDDRGTLPAPRLSALSVIVYGGPLSTGDLATAEQVRPASVTPVVQQLEQAGLITRAPDPADARRTFLTATSSGRRVLQQGRERRVGSLARYVAKLKPAQRRVLRQAAKLMDEFAAEKTT